MVSVRLLPRQQIARSTEPYSAVLVRVLQARFLALLKLMAFAAVPLAFLARPRLLPNAPIMFLCLAAILLLRKTGVVVQPKYFATAAQQLLAELANRRSAVVLAVYAASAYFYFHTFVTSLPDMDWVHIVTIATPQVPPGLPPNLDPRPHGRLRYVNERFGYLQGFMALLALVYAVKARVLNLNVLPEPAAGAPWKRVVETAPRALRSGLIVVSIASAVWPLLYFVVKNVALWPYELIGFRFQGFTGFPGLVVMALAWYKGLVLVTAWELANTCFSVYLSLNAYHGGHPLSDASPDPNGTLVLGLRAPEQTQSHRMAWQELLQISEHDAHRRVSIFKDADADRVAWRQIFQEYSRAVQALIRVLEDPKADHSHQPESSKAHHSAENKTTKEEHAHTKSGTSSFAHSNHSNRVTTTQLKGRNENPLQTLLAPAATVESSKVSATHKDLFIPRAETATLRLAHRTQDELALRSRKVAKKLDVLPQIKKDLDANLRLLHKKFLLSWLGAPFRHTVGRYLELKIPNWKQLVVEITAVANMFVASYSEDTYGYVQTDIASELADLDKLLTLLAKTAEKPIKEWPDVVVQEGLAAPDLEVLTQLQSAATVAFKSVADKFSDYFDNLKVSEQVKLRAALLR